MYRHPPLVLTHLLVAVLMGDGLIFCVHADLAGFSSLKKKSKDVLAFQTMKASQRSEGLSGTASRIGIWSSFYSWYEKHTRGAFIMVEVRMNDTLEENRHELVFMSYHCSYQWIDLYGSERGGSILLPRRRG